MNAAEVKPPRNNLPIMLNLLGLLSMLIGGFCLFGALAGDHSAILGPAGLESVVAGFILFAVADIVRTLRWILYVQHVRAAAAGL